MISLLRASRGKKPHDELKIKNLSEILTQAKNHYLMKSALQLARQVMDNLHFFFFLNELLWILHRSRTRAMKLRS